MPIATFTTADSDPAAFRFPVIQQRKKIDFLSTLLQLEGLEEDVPLLLEEKYLQERDGLNLLLRLRLEPGLRASRAPVFMRLLSPVSTHIRHHAKYAILCTRGVMIFDQDEEPSVVAISEASSLSEAAHKEVLVSLPLRPDGLKARHDLANEWGPHRLWRGYARLTNMTEEPEWSRKALLKLRQREYYSYLLGLAALRRRGGRGMVSIESEGASKYHAFLKKHEGQHLQVLLLDDEIQRGWGDAVKAVLEKPGTLDIDTSLSGVDFDTDHARVETKVAEGWDLVLADLRTSASDHGQTSLRGAKQYTGADWISKIKRDHPETAVVAFTASNKAWSVQELQQLGIDGYWTKESPEFGVDDAYSAANAARLLDIVRHALEPRIEAKPVWKLITELERQTADKRFVDEWVKTMGISKLDVTFRLQAIESRVRRAYGFLVMSRSQHARDQFGMQRYDLAFLTLWSGINEVVKLYFDDPRNDPAFTFKGSLNKVWDAEFAIRNPSTGDRQTYWHLKNGSEVVAPRNVPAKLVDALCPGSSCSKDSTPSWPWGRSDTAGIAWLLGLVGQDVLVNRFDDKEYDGRPGLRELRNKLEYEHGRYGDLEEATLEEVHAMCDIWRALLVTPYS